MGWKAQAQAQARDEAAPCPKLYTAYSCRLSSRPVPTGENPEFWPDSTRADPENFKSDFTQPGGSPPRVAAPPANQAALSPKLWSHRRRPGPLPSTPKSRILFKRFT